MTREAMELVAALIPALGLDSDDDPLEFTIDQLTASIATLIVVLQCMLDATKIDEQHAML